MATPQKRGRKSFLQNQPSLGLPASGMNVQSEFSSLVMNCLRLVETAFQLSSATYTEFSFMIILILQKAAFSLVSPWGNRQKKFLLRDLSREQSDEFSRRYGGILFSAYTFIGEIHPKNPP